VFGGSVGALGVPLSGGFQMPSCLVAKRFLQGEKSRNDPKSSNFNLGEPALFLNRRFFRIRSKLFCETSQKTT